MKKKIRFIPRLDLKNDKLIKSIQLEGLRVIGSPYEYAYKYYKENADELIFLDSVASLYSRKSIISVINEVTKNIFIPITVGGGIRSLKDVETLLTNVQIKLPLIQELLKILNFSLKFPKNMEIPLLFSL